MNRHGIILSVLFTCSIASALVFNAQSAAADPVVVTVTGEVEYNQVGSGFLGNVVAGDAVVMSFILDTLVYEDSITFPTRGYAIDQSSFLLSFAGNSIGLENPFPSGETPYFVLRDNDPGVDGFFIATSVDFPVGVPIGQQGSFSQFTNNFQVTYDQTLLSSLDIADASGTYDFTGLTVFNWTIEDGPFQPVGIIFSEMQITLDVIPEPGPGAVLACMVVALAGKRRRRAEPC